MTIPADVDLVCFDIDGTLTRGVGGEPFPGAVEAVRRIARRLPVRYVTNATSRTHGALVEALARHGFPVGPDQVFHPASTAGRVLPGRGHDRGLLLVDEGARADFSWFVEDPEGPAVVLATEGHDRRIADLQPLFRRLLEGAVLYAMQRNRFFEKEGALWTDVGPLAAFLEYAADVRCETLGKPSRLLFEAVAASAGTTPDRIVMVGDDAEFDVAGPAAFGVRGVLVRTGKYRPGDEERHERRPWLVVEGVAELAATWGL